MFLSDFGEESLLHGWRRIIRGNSGWEATKHGVGDDTLSLGRQFSAKERKEKLHFLDDEHHSSLEMQVDIFHHPNHFDTRRVGTAVPCHDRRFRKPRHASHAHRLLTASQERYQSVRRHVPVHEPLPLLDPGAPVQSDVGVPVQGEELLQDVQHPRHLFHKKKTPRQLDTSIQLRQSKRQREGRLDDRPPAAAAAVISLLPQQEEKIPPPPAVNTPS